MAIEYLANGATSLAAANWSGSGFADNATLIIEQGSQTITGGLDQSGLTTGIDYLDIRPGFTGNIGSPSAGALTVDADTTTADYIRYAALGGTLYLNAGGGSGVIRNFYSDGRGTSYLTGGTFTTVIVSSGTCYIQSGTVVTNLYVLGGRVVISDNATAITLANITSRGQVTSERPFTTVNIGGGGYLDYDNDDGDALGTVTLDGGTFVHRSGDIGTYTGKSGLHDIRYAQRAIEVGTSAATLYAALDLRYDMNQVTLSNTTYIGSPAQSSGPTPA